MLYIDVHKHIIVGVYSANRKLIVIVITQSKSSTSGWCVCECYKPRLSYSIHTRKNMEWQKYYMDMLLVPCGFLILVFYHYWLWHMTRSQPYTTTFGRDADGRRFWVPTMMKVTHKTIALNFILFLNCKWKIL